MIKIYKSREIFTFGSTTVRTILPAKGVVVVQWLRRVPTLVATHTDYSMSRLPVTSLSQNLFKLMSTGLVMPSNHLPKVGW